MDSWEVSKMAAASDDAVHKKGDGNIPPWADGEKLRKVEQNVLIPKKMREKARENCKDFVEAFSNCAKGRTVSMVWACGQENNSMRECLTSHFKKKETYEESKKEYLMERQKYQQEYAKSGKESSVKRKESSIM